MRVAKGKVQGFESIGIDVNTLENRFPHGFATFLFH